MRRRRLLQVAILDLDFDQRAFLFVKQVIGRRGDVRHAQLHGGFQLAGRHAARHDVGAFGVSLRERGGASGFGGLQVSLLGFQQRKLDCAGFLEQRFQLRRISGAACGLLQGASSAAQIADSAAQCREF